MAESPSTVCQFYFGLVKMDKPLVSVVLGSYNRRDYIKPALESIRNNGIDFSYEIIVVDGGSTDGTLKYLVSQKDVITIVQHNRGEFRGKKIARRNWGYFMNLGFKVAQGKYILMISDDCLLIPGAIKNGVDEFESRLSAGINLGALAFYWRNWPEEMQYRVGLTLDDKMFVNHGMYLRAALEKVGWIDEQTFQFYHADGDLCLKLWQAGYYVEDCKTAFVEHCDQVKFRSAPMPSEQDWEAYLKKWEGIFYNPQKNNYGRWVYHSYTDPHQTYMHFPALRNGRWEVGKAVLSHTFQTTVVFMKKIRWYVFSLFRCHDSEKKQG